ncbi:hypothetical protein [Legionella impletisoli]|uniref:Coiled-coil protein n=1 Tax=Legionella impletisoli TaxID=343510 RepID=A0A917NBW2_9GAMM|nr:hypothetical protein [Legionella impletisoli]GGI86843.1 hypothetical protein GCM10007966_14380 [Legionella impletisoli]
MTIFLILAKKIILAELKELRNQSIGSDQSLPNRVFSTFWLGRDAEVSDAKRDILDELIQNIRSFKPKETDEDNLEALLHLIAEGKEMAKKVSDEKGFVNEGMTGPALESLMRLLNSVRDKLQEHQLTDLECKNDPYGIFCFFAAKYLATKLVDDLKKGKVADMLDNPKVSSAALISSKKDLILRRRLLLCKVMIERRDLSIDELSIRECVKSAIDNILADNRTLCEEGAKVSLPFGVTLFRSLHLGPTLNPSLGRLAVFMNAAMAALENPALYDAELRVRRDSQAAPAPASPG